jgi:imidazole glycerol-phosphate synthase subunit HisH
MNAVTVIDTGIGNIGNLLRALEQVGASPTLTKDPAVVASAHRLCLPGVGAFRPPRERLRGALETALRRAVDQGAFLLGICVGYQLLFESSDEFGATDGLGMLSGQINRLPDNVSLPHIGWNRLIERRQHPLLAGLGDDPYVYFVHSFAPVGVPPAETLASCRHGADFAAVAGRGRVMGTQFHPEKSAAVGLRLLRNFVELDEAWN